VFGVFDYNVFGGTLSLTQSINHVYFRLINELKDNFRCITIDY